MLTHKTSQNVFPPDHPPAADPPSKRMILKEALRLFAQRGIDAVTVRDIGNRAGYTNAALFKFFATKDALALFYSNAATWHCSKAFRRPCVPRCPSRSGSRHRDGVHFPDRPRSRRSSCLFRINCGRCGRACRGALEDTPFSVWFRATLEQGVRENRSVPTSISI